MRLLVPLLVGVALVAGLAYALTTDRDPLGRIERLIAGGTAPVVGRPGTQSVEVPDVRGQGQNAAEAILRQRGFDVSVQSRESTADQAGLVVDQSPGAGGRAEKGSTITLFVGNGPSSVTVPDLGYESTAAADLDYAGLVLGSTTYQASNDFAAGLVISADPAEGAQAPKGSTVNIVVSSGPAATPSQPVAPSQPATPSVQPSDGTSGGSSGQGGQQSQPNDQNNQNGGTGLPGSDSRLPNIPGLGGGGNGGGNGGNGGSNGGGNG